MPHTWDMVQRLGEPENRGGDTPIWQSVAGYAWYTFRLAFARARARRIVVGVVLAVVMARFRIAERGLLPWIIMSQTVPLIALAPQVVSWSGKVDLFGWEWPRWLVGVHARGVPVVLPDRRRHAARPQVAAGGGGRTDGQLCRVLVDAR